MPSSSFLVRGLMSASVTCPAAEMKAHSHRAVPTVTSPIAMDQPKNCRRWVVDGRQVQGPNLFWRPHINESLHHDILYWTHSSALAPPPAVHLLPRPVLSSLTPEILAPTVVESIQTLSVTVSHNLIGIPPSFGDFAPKRAETRNDECSTAVKDQAHPRDIRLECATEEKNIGGSTRRSKRLGRLGQDHAVTARVRLGGAPAPPHIGVQPEGAS
ncbi:hypothetical protein BASA62_001944 [Batrachochytrium salamandrivorans]|nr:hypothetical protein BASA62_001944 [Batrachochytrium salamandrivorans]